uniref:Uncharacterized protein n=1 Tax=Peronospora matthiolae TaxID=2874970 RepID=A0AAV1TJQ3_9STRA
MLLSAWPKIWIDVQEIVTNTLDAKASSADAAEFNNSDKQGTKDRTRKVFPSSLRACDAFPGIPEQRVSCDGF